MLRQRLITAAVLIAIASLMFVLGPFALRILVLFLYSVGSYEFVRLRRSLEERESILIALLYTSLPLSFWFWGASGVLVSTVITALILICSQIVKTEKEDHQGFPVEVLGHLFLGLAYLGIFGTLLFAAVGHFSRSELCWLLIMVIAADSGAYFGGRAIGGPKLAPRISPNKTCSGALCGIASSMLVSLFVGRWLGILVDGSSVAVFYAMLAGLIVSVLSIFGDLTESLLKRAHDVKDSGTLFPGHGGVLDRIDGLLFAAPALYLLGGCFS